MHPGTRNLFEFPEKSGLRILYIKVTPGKVPRTK
jgi:hypothetical protein